MKFKLTSLEKKWVLYDVGNSAFTLMVSTIFPIYFNALAENAGISDVDYLAYWGLCHIHLYADRGDPGSDTWSDR